KSSMSEPRENLNFDIFTTQRELPIVSSDSSVVLCLITAPRLDFFGYFVPAAKVHRLELLRTPQNNLAAPVKFPSLLQWNVPNAWMKVASPTSAQSVVNHGPAVRVESI